MKGSTVTIRNVTKLFGLFPAVSNVSFEIQKGEFFSLLGPSGCGKTTLLRIIAAFLVSITLSLEDFVITFFVAGPGSSTLPLHVYSMIRFGVSPVINALSVVHIVGSVLLAFSTRGLYKYILQK